VGGRSNLKKCRNLGVLYERQRRRRGLYAAICKKRRRKDLNVFCYHDICQGEVETVKSEAATAIISIVTTCKGLTMLKSMIIILE